MLTTIIAVVTLVSILVTSLIWQLLEDRPNMTKRQKVLLLKAAASLSCVGILGNIVMYPRTTGGSSFLLIVATLLVLASLIITIKKLRLTNAQV